MSAPFHSSPCSPWAYLQRVPSSARLVSCSLFYFLVVPSHDCQWCAAYTASQTLEKLKTLDFRSSFDIGTELAFQAPISAIQGFASPEDVAKPTRLVFG